MACPSEFCCIYVLLYWLETLALCGLGLLTLFRSLYSRHAKCGCPFHLSCIMLHKNNIPLKNRSSALKMVLQLCMTNPVPSFHTRSPGCQRIDRRGPQIAVDSKQNLTRTFYKRFHFSFSLTRMERRPGTRTKAHNTLPWAPDVAVVYNHVMCTWRTLSNEFDKKWRPVVLTMNDIRLWWCRQWMTSGCGGVDNEWRQAVVVSIMNDVRLW